MPADVSELPRVVAQPATDEVEHCLRIGCAFGVTEHDRMPAPAVWAA
jgi:hypothetical protein